MTPFLLAVLWFTGGLFVGLLWGKISRFGSGEDDSDEYPWWDNEDWGDKS